MSGRSTLPWAGRRPAPRFAALAAVLLAALASWAAARTVSIAGRPVATRAIGNTEYVLLSEVVKSLLGKYWLVNGRFVVVLPGDSGGPGQEYVFRPDSAFVLRSDRRVTLPLPPVLDDSQLCLPVDVLLQLFPDGPVRRLSSIAATRQGDTTIIAVTAAKSSPASPLRALDDSRSSLECRVSLSAGCDSAFARQANLVAARPGILKSVVADTGARTTLRLTFTQPAAHRLLVQGDTAEVRVWPRPLRHIGRIVLDPGHGGTDPGATGRRGTEEKTVVLDVARRLQAKLAAKGYDVIMARDSDKVVTLAERSQTANASKADLFVSIHANWAPNRGACGLETYFLSEAKTDWERAVAARENGSLDPAGSDTGASVGGDLGLILADLAQNEFLVESSDLAAEIQEATVPVARIKDRGVRQANFFVLRNSYMPAVLVECGFLSNRAEEKLLRKPEHRENLAEGICRGIIAFVQQYERKVNGS